MMEIMINGEARQVAPDTTLGALIASLEVGSKVAACAVNMEVVKKEQWREHTLKSGDRVELLQFVGGG